MENIKNLINKEVFVENLFYELSKLPFGNLPKTELELIILHSIIESQGGYDKLNKISGYLPRELKISQTKFKNKVLEAQLRYDKTTITAQEYLKNTINKNKFSDLIFDDTNLVLYISNPLLLENIKTYFDINEIVNDTSFNKNILKVNKKGMIKILVNILDEYELEKLESELKKIEKLNSLNFSLINNLNIDSIFSTSVDPFGSMGKFVEFIKKTLA